MAETAFIFSDDDFGELVEFILEEGGRFVPNYGYERPKYQELTELESLTKANKETRLFLFSTRPISSALLS